MPHGALLPHNSRMAQQNRLRIGRVSLPGQPYHVITATAGRWPLFAAHDAARAVIRVMRPLHEAGWLHSHAWVLMPDHLHWLFTLGERATLSVTMNRFKSGSAHAVRNLHPEIAHVWQSGFFDHGIRRDEDLRAVARYIVANPLRAALCEHVGDIHGGTPNGSDNAVGGPLAGRTGGEDDRAVRSRRKRRSTREKSMRILHHHIESIHCFD